MISIDIPHSLAGGAITILKNMKVSWEGWHPIYEMENKIHVWNHQTLVLVDFIPPMIPPEGLLPMKFSQIQVGARCVGYSSSSPRKKKLFKYPILPACLLRKHPMFVASHYLQILSPLHHQYISNILSNYVTMFIHFRWFSMTDGFPSDKPPYGSGIFNVSRPFFHWCHFSYQVGQLL